ncbi:hypothetical protein [Butyrivibrio sp. VCB2001]|uniref:hypothetical protein n=1 Tax=Butyrivibrio sp. VCB2001 TaxID=1280667 RepID=UPI0003FBDE68|nr:hypothetical protein [Butyrivibrio sp. VCB2001]
MKKKSIYIGILIAMTMLAGCGKQDEQNSNIFESVSNETAATETTSAAEITPEAETEPEADTAKEVEEAPSEAATSGMKDGDRFDDVIILEGMEETVHYEHVINESIGLEMDYDYESFVRYSEPESECFISIYDDAQKPENYLEIVHSNETAESVADTIAEDLSKEYDITRTDMELDHDGNCVKISASEDKNTHGTADMIYVVYIIPREDGCLIAKESMYFEASEGFGRRFNYMVNTIR